MSVSIHSCVGACMHGSVDLWGCVLNMRRVYPHSL